MPRAAYTLIELVIVLLIMGILAGAAAPTYFASLDTFQVEAAAKRVAADLRYARREARSSAASRTVTFTTGDDQYSLAGVTAFNRRQASYDVDLSDAGYPATIVSTAFMGDSLTFDIHGSPSEIGSVVLTSGLVTRNVLVSQTGDISITE